MNLEDFKSFRRVLITSEVGSIPTHSLQIRRALAAACIVIASGGVGGPARAAEVVPPGSPSPFGRAMRSAVFPAWGQLTNGKSKKAVVVFTAQTYVLSRLIVESRAARAADRRADALSGREDPEGIALEAAARASAQEHYDTRRDMLFWALLGAFYGAVDAYVDAHLGNFGEELDESRRLFANADPTERRVELGIRF